MPLHNVVGINCKKGTTTENQGEGVSIWAKGCMLMIVSVLSDLTFLPLLGGGRMSSQKVTVYYYKLIHAFLTCNLKFKLQFEESHSILL